MSRELRVPFCHHRQSRRRRPRLHGRDLLNEASFCARGWRRYPPRPSDDTRDSLSTSICCPISTRRRPAAFSFRTRHPRPTLRGSTPLRPGALRACLEPGALNILVSHCFVAGSAASEGPSASAASGGPRRFFPAFDYVALGHLHAPQRAGDNRYYAGSPLKYSFDEASQRKGLQLVELEGERILSGCCLSPRCGEGSFEAELTSGREVPTEDYCLPC